MSIVTDKLRLYFEANGIKIKDVAEALGVTSSAVSNMLADRDPIGKNRAKRLSEVYGFNYLFLLGTPGYDIFDKATNTQVIGEMNGGVAIQAGDASTVSVGDGGKACPSREELLAMIAELRASVDEKERAIRTREDEVHFLRRMVEALVPKGKSSQNLQTTGNSQEDNS